jgi:hypothetical protein
MKIGGIDPQTLPIEEILVLPRGEEQIVFRATGISSYKEFDTLCPTPKPPGKLVKGSWEPNEDDPDYKSIVAIHSRKKLAWMVINSLIPSDIEWENVDLAKPSTWTNWESEMKSAGLTQIECNRIVQLVFGANCLDEEKLARARENFLAGQGPVPSEFSGQSTEPETSQSGEPASE